MSKRGLRWKVDSRLRAGIVVLCLLAKGTILWSGVASGVWFGESYWVRCGTHGDNVGGGPGTSAGPSRGNPPALCSRKQQRPCPKTVASATWFSVDGPSQECRWSSQIWAALCLPQPCESTSQWVPACPPGTSLGTASPCSAPLDCPLGLRDCLLDAKLSNHVCTREPREFQQRKCGVASSWVSHRPERRSSQEASGCACRPALLGPSIFQLLCGARGNQRWGLIGSTAQEGLPQLMTLAGGRGVGSWTQVCF